MPSRRDHQRASTAAASPADSRGRAWRFVPWLAIIVVLAGAAVYLLMDAPLESNQQSGLIASAPPIVFEPASFDFGEMPPRTTKSDTILLRNTGSGQLRIVTARPSCACLRAELGPTVLEPGSSVQMPIQLNSLSTPGEATFTLNVMVAGYEDPAVFNVRRTTLAE